MSSWQAAAAGLRARKLVGKTSEKVQHEAAALFPQVIAAKVEFDQQLHDTEEAVREHAIVRHIQHALSNILVLLEELSASEPKER